MRKLSLNARAAHDGTSSAEVEVALVRIVHPETQAVIRLSSDPTERLSAEPLTYGTRSTWLTDDGSPFLFVLISVLLPDDKEEAPGAAQMVLDAVDESTARLLRSTVRRATMDVAVVLAASPDRVEAQFRNFRLINAEGNDQQITLSYTRDQMTGEPWPAGRMSREWFPGLFK
ncbi:hypothetical protein [Microcystis phage Mwe-Yong1]|nr:hypothetical protein [Microcystis phage Mwe-Yong1]